MADALRSGKKMNNDRRYPGMGGARHNPVRLAEKREDALGRNGAWKALTPKQKLADLDRRLGPGKGAKRQRARIEAMMLKVTDPAPASLTDKKIVTSPEKGKLKAKDRRVAEKK